ncbi:uncharacterized protein TNIN_446261 [Trichonephila inaurata madagascariensis]|uniref:Uncharacterized protein n=1 Tax=Trichonephila inaurata madagascariensis TaxID=2747483 RepID=A0A8X7CS78_9ARAC|nr:uncharacterized protein TNIN_446261 [Trichonephila inaurata madagascariensis]
MDNGTSCYVMDDNTATKDDDVPFPDITSFSRLKSSKRQFYVLDDRHWRLFFYRCEEDFRSSKPPLGSIALSEAAINLTSSEDVHQFVVQNSSESDPDKWLFTSIPK